jgi:hypothetical protein
MIWIMFCNTLFPLQFYSTYTSSEWTFENTTWLMNWNHIIRIQYQKGMLYSFGNYYIFLLFIWVNTLLFYLWLILIRCHWICSGFSKSIKFYILSKFFGCFLMNVIYGSNIYSYISDWLRRDYIDYSRIMLFHTLGYSTKRSDYALSFGSSFVELRE